MKVFLKHVNGIYLIVKFALLAANRLLQILPEFNAVNWAKQPAPDETSVATRSYGRRSRGMRCVLLLHGPNEKSLLPGQEAMFPGSRQIEV